MASERVPFANPVKFGDDLELDPGAYELRRAGRPLKLERIPMELLLLLVEQHGQLVTREHIIERIWGKDVFLDADSSINSAIRKDTPCSQGRSGATTFLANRYGARVSVHRLRS